MRLRSRRRYEGNDGWVKRAYRVLWEYRVDRAQLLLFISFNNNFEIIYYFLVITGVYVFHAWRSRTDNE